ncbi:hypothetical protein DRQ26_06510 [bacterium]|nr:MAG: hypothetical protein DRQ26_06510 [bacterium]
MEFTRLRRELHLFDVFAIASGAMISSGLFILPGLAHAKAGPAVVISYLLAGFLASTGMLCKAELASAMPRAGGTYFYITRSMGPAAGTSAGILLWLSLTFKSSFALIGMAVFTQFFTTIHINYIAMALTVFFVIVNIVGVKTTVKIQISLVIGILVLITLYIIFGLREVSADKLMPFLPAGWRAVFATSGFVFISYGGILKVASVAEEVKNPGRNIPLGMSLALVVITIVYSLVVFITAGVLDASVLDNSLMPLYLGGRAIFGNIGALAMAIAAIFAFITTANAGILAASRYPMAMSRDMLLPKLFARVHPKRRTPHISILITGAIMIAVLFLPLEALVKTASTALILTFIFDILSLIIMRQSGLQNYQPIFKAPFYPYLQIVGLVGFGFLIYEMGLVQIAISLGFIFLGLLWYWFYGRIRATRNSALAHMLAGFSSKALRGDLLETELREIIRERDSIVADRFDEIVEKAPVIDIPQKVDMDELFRLVSQKLAPLLGESREQIFKLLMERESESSTVLRGGLAIPHIIVEGEKKFEIVIVRCRDGIEFSGAEKPVHCVFVMAGSRDERNFYLKALAATIEITSEQKFDAKWMKAKNSTALKDIILLGKRRRGLS